MKRLSPLTRVIVFLSLGLIPLSWSAPLLPILTAVATSAAGLFQIQIDTLHIAKYFSDSSTHKPNRAAFVRDLLYTAFYRSGQLYNVIVFNLAEEHHQHLYGVNFYGSVTYKDGTRFGVWVFEYGSFENHGARGWHNWGMIGSFRKSTNGNTIYFQRRIANVKQTTTTISPAFDGGNITTLLPSTWASNSTTTNSSLDLTTLGTTLSWAEAPSTLTSVVMTTTSLPSTPSTMVTSSTPASTSTFGDLLHNFPKTEVSKANLFGKPVKSVILLDTNLTESYEQSDHNDGGSLMDAIKIVKRKDNDQSSMDVMRNPSKASKKSKPIIGKAVTPKPNSISNDDDESILPP